MKTIEELEKENFDLKARVEELEQQFAFECECNKDLVKLQNKEQSINELIDYVLADNLLEENDHEKYLNFIEKDIFDLEEMKSNNNIEDCLCSHLVEELELLRDIIMTAKGE